MRSLLWLVLFCAAACGCAGASPASGVPVPSSVSIAHVGDATVICTTLSAAALDAGDLQ